MTVAALITEAQNRTTLLTTQAQTALNSAVSAVESVGYTLTTFTGATLPSAPAALVSLTPPTLLAVTLNLPGEPGPAPTYQDISAIEPGGVPTLGATAPEITMPTDPSQLAAFSGSAPSITTSFVFPNPPSELTNPLIAAPTLATHVEPTAPQVMLPAFTAVTPTDTTVAPTNLDTTFGNAYSGAAPSMVTMVNGYVDAMLTQRNPQYNAQMAAIEAQLTKYLAGGTGLNAAVENAIYARAQSKNDAEARRVRDAAYAEAASRGFTLPSGALMSAMQTARQAGADNNAKAATEITVLQAEMEQKNLQFAVTTSTALRTTVLNATLSYMQNLSQINGQAIDYAKTILSSILEMYNTSVKAYSVKLEGYKTEAAVYETRLKAAMASVELYKAEIQALEAMTQVDKTRVDVYRARIDSLTALSNVYRAQIEAVQGRASLEKLKLDLFQTQVQTYTAQVQGKNAEWQGYTAAINGQQAKAQIYATQVQAFGAQVQAYKADIEAKAEVVKATATTNDARARQYSATLQGYQAVVQARGQVASTTLENQRQQVVAFQAQTQAAIGNAQVQNEYYKATSMVAIENAKLAITTAFQSADSKRAYSSSLAQIATANAQIYGNLAGAALAGINTLAAETVAE
jgi:uncharacterized protein YegP (UPF0339 family)